MQRTVRLMLHPTPEQGSALAETTRLFTGAFNDVCAVGWERGEKNGVTLHHETYRRLRARYPALLSDLHIQARVKATEAVRSALALRRKGRQVQMPTSASCPPRFNVHTFKVNWEGGIVNVATTRGRQHIAFHLPEYARRYVGLPVDTADLMFRAGRWWLHVVVTVPAPDITPCPDGIGIVGVDLGLACPAVTSTGHFLGLRRWRGIEARTFRLRRALQKRGTRSAKRHLRRLRGWQRRFRRDCDHVLSKQIVQAVPQGGTVVLENLKGIRGRVRVRHGPESRRIHGWSFAQLKSFIVYKAEERAVTVAGVNPRHTSQQCSRCGHTARNNRRSPRWFQCRACGFSLHADLNGARNIAAKYLVPTGIPGRDGCPVNAPNVGDDVVHRSPASRLL